MCGGIARVHVSSSVFPRFEFLFVLHSDTCAAGLGAVLMHERKGKLHLIAYASRSCCPAEWNYLFTELESLAVDKMLSPLTDHL